MPFCIHVSYCPVLYRMMRSNGSVFTINAFHRAFHASIEFKRLAAAVDTFRKKRKFIRYTNACTVSFQCESYLRHDLNLFFLANSSFSSDWNVKLTATLYALPIALWLYPQLKKKNIFFYRLHFITTFNFILIESKKFIL